MTYTPMQLARKLRSPHNEVAVQAVVELQTQGWLSGELLERAHLRFVHLQQADLHGANMRDANLSMADLRWADLSGANLTGARLNRANLRGADLSETNLQGALMTRANLQGARNLTDAQLAQASRLRGATLPDGSYYDGRYNLPGDARDASLLGVDTTDPADAAAFYGVLPEEYQRGQEWTYEYLERVWGEAEAAEGQADLTFVLASLAKARAQGKPSATDHPSV